MLIGDFEKEALALVLRGKKILLGVSGSIAAFKAVDLVRILKEVGADVRVAMTENAKQFVTPLTFETLSGNKVYTSLWDAEEQGTHHIDLARWADAFLMAPSSANLIAKLSLGLADDLLSTEYLAFDGPAFIVPAMNPNMWSAASVQRNVDQLKKDGVTFLGPVHGETSCGEVGEGRMLEPEECVIQLAEGLRVQSKNPGKWLLTMGPTSAAMDPVRKLTNRSSGKMGAAIAWAAWARGEVVEVITGPIDIRLPNSTVVRSVETTAEMAEEVQARWKDSEIFVGAAAVLDWEFVENPENKLKAKEGEFSVKLKPSKDVIASVASQKSGTQIVVGFAAETQNLVSNAKQKLLKKNLDAVIANDVADSKIGFDSEFNSGWWLSRDNEVELQFQSKMAMAVEIVDRILKMQQVERGRSGERTRNLSVH